MSAQGPLFVPFWIVHYAIANDLESMEHLPAPIGPLVRTIWHGKGPDTKKHDHLTVFATGPTSVIVFAATHEHIGLGKHAHYFAQYPTLRTITMVQLALPMQLETDRQVRRLAEHSHVSVFAKVNGSVRAVVQRESFSTPGGAIKFWVSDLVKQDDAKCLPDEFIRPLYNEYVFSSSFLSRFRVEPHIS